MTGLYIFVALAVIALVGWGVAELKYKSIHFTHSEAEREEAELLEKEKAENPRARSAKLRAIERKSK